MFQMKLQRKSKHTFLFTNFFSENLAVYEIVSKNMVEPERPQMTLWRMRVAYCRSTATRMHLPARTFPRTEIYVLLCHSNNGFSNSSQCYVPLTLFCFKYIQIVSVRTGAA